MPSQATSSAPPRTTTTISLRQSIGFGIGDFYGGGQMTLTMTYLSLFWTRFCDLDIQTAQTIIGMSTIISAFSALFFGALSDNLYRFPIGRRFGRRRLLLLIMSPIVLVGMLMWVPGLNPEAYFCIYMIWIMLSQIFMTAYNALPSEMTTDFKGRTLLSSTRLFISNGSCTLIPLIGSATLSTLGEDRASSYQIFTMSFTVLFSITLFICWRSTWELSPEEAGFAAYADGSLDHLHVGVSGWAKRMVKLVREYVSTLRIRSFRQHLAIYLLLMCGMDIFGQTFAYFVIFNWGQTAAFASLLLTLSALALPLMPVCNWGMIRFGPRTLFSIGFSGMGIGLVWMLGAWLLRGTLAGGAWTAFAVTGAVVFFAFRTSAGFLPWQIFPLIADVDRIVTERNRSATFAGVQAFFRQLCSGIVAMSVGVALRATGFDAQRDTQPFGAQIGLASITLGIYLVGVVLAWIVSRSLILDRRTDNELLGEIDRLRSGGAKHTVDPRTRRTVEQLTGMPYDDVWPDAKP